jgi:hypothetical protein
LIATALDKGRCLPEAGEVSVTENVPALELAVTLSILVDTFLPFTFVVTFVALAEYEPLVLKFECALLECSEMPRLAIMQTY